MIQGKCNCGAVVFEVSSKIADVYFCHCSICRRSTGANGIAVIVTNNDDFNWVSGEELVKTWSKPGHDWQASFCTHCGSSLPGSNDASRMYIPAGLLPQIENLQITHHIWVGSKANWDVIGGTGVQHDQAFNS
ncbi:GFA family protein [Shewanella sp. KX20019]|uniref:GFA family protein n=1 Tax=Shewanella sp. KX20019 TaxID=2803864 RepID=UPI0019259571|nr:GFA family protein [Shewanella sp. KX20019]QQX79463.1 GFA family protein [Shewanella sp. KX20019]